MPGTLFVVATPIGNLEDLTFRALRTLKEADLIAAEDTRRTSKLLSHYAISKPLLSLREHNEAREAVKLIGRLKAGQNIALVSDAGTPAIADPGARLVRAARAEGIRVIPIPGPSAITAAVSVAGLDAPQFTFVGFPPSARIARRNWLEGLRDVSGAIVFFEAPHRIFETISDVYELLVKRQVQMFREITKINEEYIERPTNNTEMLATYADRGEFTIVVGPDDDKPSAKDINILSAYMLYDLLNGSGLISETSIIRTVATALDINVDMARNAVKKGKILAMRQKQA
jgi:16S rRNA (cytidine1402-2'-O)-methyltransferase